MTEDIIISRNSDFKTSKFFGSKFFGGVFILTLSGILVKLMGLLFKIPLQHLIGDEGMGYFNCAYTLYTWVYIVTTAGVPVSVSVLVAENIAKNEPDRAEWVKKTALRVLFPVGILASGAMLALAFPAARLFGANDAAVAVSAVAPTLFFICLSSVYRGYYQGRQNMAPTALSQIAEGLGKLLCGLAFANYAVKVGYDIPYVAAFACLGITVGAAFGTSVLLVRRALDRNRRIKPRKFPVLGRFAAISFPVMLSSSVTSLTNLIDLGVTVRRLVDAGYSEKAAMALFGNYTTLAVPMFNLPAVLIYPIAGVIVPMITAKIAENGGRLGASNELVASAVKLTCAVSLPCSLGLAFLSEPILRLLYSEASAELGAPMLTLLAPSVFPLCLVTVTNAVLQAMGRAKLTLVSMASGGAAKLIVSTLLLGIPDVGIMGSPIGTFFCYLVAAAMNIYFLSKTADGVLPFGKLSRMLICAAASVATGVAVALLTVKLGRASVVIGILSALPVYLFTIIKIGGLDGDINILKNSKADR